MGYSAHVTNDTLAFVRFAFEKVDAVLDTNSADSLELLPQEILVPLLVGVICKHHEHEEKRE